MKKQLLLFMLLATLCRADSTALFNGKDLTGWKAAPIADCGLVKVLTNGVVECGIGDPMSGIVYTNTPPTMNYELSLEALRAEGSDFFVALTLPVETNCCTVVIGGWGGGLCGISSVDYADASENPWSENLPFTNNRWYHLRVRVTPGVLQVYLNNDLYKARIEYDTSSRFSLRPGDIEKTRPLGLATYRTRALWRNFTLTPITVFGAADQRGSE